MGFKIGDIVKVDNYKGVSFNIKEIKKDSKGKIGVIDKVEDNSFLVVFGKKSWWFNAYNLKLAKGNTSKKKISKSEKGKPKYKQFDYILCDVHSGENPTTPIFKPNYKGYIVSCEPLWNDEIKEYIYRVNASAIELDLPTYYVSESCIKKVIEKPKEKEIGMTTKEALTKWSETVGMKPETVGMISFHPKFQIGDIVRYNDNKKGKITVIKYSYSSHLTKEYNYISYMLDTGVEVTESFLTLVRRKGEKKEEILDKTEKRYLYNIIRPFKNRVISISKSSDLLEDRYYILINLKDDAESIDLPFFKKDTMYKGMELDEVYTLKELGL